MGSALGFTSGLWLGAIAPLEYLANLKRMENLARAYYSNMDPGVVVSLALFIVVPIMFVCIVTDAIRLIFGGQPLSILGAFVFGLFIAAPFAYSTTVSSLSLSFLAYAAVLALQLAIFYAIRTAILKTRGRKRE